MSMSHISRVSIHSAGQEAFLSCHLGSGWQSESVGYVRTVLAMHVRQRCLGVATTDMCPAKLACHQLLHWQVLGAHVSHMMTLL